MTHIYLIRHGDYDGVVNGQQIENPGLSAKGMRQTELLRDRLARTGEIAADALIASPTRRAQETALALAPVLGRTILLDKAFEEWRCDNGVLSAEEFDARWSAVAEPQRPFFQWVEGGESWVEFAARMQLAFNRVEQTYAGKTVVIVAHGGVTQASFIYFMSLSATATPGIATEYTAITHWSKADAALRWTLEAHNDHQHLPSLA